MLWMACKNWYVPVTQPFLFSGFFVSEGFRQIFWEKFQSPNFLLSKAAIKSFPLKCPVSLNTVYFPVELVCSIHLSFCAHNLCHLHLPVELVCSIHLSFCAHNLCHLPKSSLLCCGIMLFHEIIYTTLQRVLCFEMFRVNDVRCCTCYNFTGSDS